ncbi:MAG TPA: M28 family peptidase [Mucilaginibacter sp.]|jgi:hypothetical protein
MIKITKPILVISLISLSVTGIAQQIKLSKEVENALNGVDTAQIKADITYLADDKLKGRLPGTEGYQMAVDYVVSQLKALGVKPAGENNTWLQEVRLRRAFVHNPVITTNTDQEKLYGYVSGSYAIFPNPALPDVKITAGLAFAGYGISEPSLGYDDYAGIDVKGKIVLITRGTPDKFSSSVAAHVMSSTHLVKVAAEHGAVGVIVCMTDSTARTPNLSRGIYSVLDKDKNVAVSSTYYSDQVKVFGSVVYNMFKGFLKDNGVSLDTLKSRLKSGRPNSFLLTRSMNVSYSTTYQDIISYNVIGKIEGSDPELKNTYVVHSAHLDHLGIGTPVQGDSLYNGAHDNASGVASVLGIAKIYKNIKQKPKRSILMVLMTGEEMGDLGSGYFAKYPTVPVKDIVADVNTDMPTIIAPLLSITALGAEHSSLINQVNEAAAYLNLGVEPDPEPKQARFTRSDQYSFVLQGIPALHIKYGSKTADGKNNLNDFVAIWRAKYYHKPQDDINGIFNFGAGKTYAELNFLIGYLVAQDAERPTWNPGDIFSVK